MNGGRISEFALSILVMWVIFGGVLTGAGFTDDWSPTAALRPLPNGLELFLGLTLVLGTSLVLFGALPKHELASKRWAYETSGFTLTAVVWLAFSFATFVVTPASVVLWIPGLGFTLASITRALRVWNVADRIRGIKKMIDDEEK